MALCKSALDAGTQSFIHSSIHQVICQALVGVWNGAEHKTQPLALTLTPRSSQGGGSHADKPAPWRMILAPQRPLSWVSQRLREPGADLEEPNWPHQKEGLEASEHELT